MDLDQIENIRDPKTKVRALCEYACQVNIDPNISVLKYIRSSKEMLRMADTYNREKDIKKAFLLYSKYATLFIEKLPKHPQYVSFSKTDDMRHLKKKTDDVLKIAASLKQKLITQYTAIENDRQRREEAEEEAKRNAEFLRLQELEIAESKKREREEEKRKEKYMEEEIKKLEISQSKGAWEDEYRFDPPDYNTAINQGPSVPDRALKPKSNDSSINYHFTSVGSNNSNQYGLRTVIIPGDLVPIFIRMAEVNTSRNVETCGILGGRLQQNNFIITHLIIPNQQGTPDTCTTLNEEKIFEYQDKYDLITLGWIHTHPSQSLFLSSVDLHTQLSYQIMLPEAIAIVYSEKEKDTAVFQLTPSIGIEYLKNCNKTTFHPHSKPDHELFEHATNVKFDEAISIEIEDQRV